MNRTPQGSATSFVAAVGCLLLALFAGHSVAGDSDQAAEDGCNTLSIDLPNQFTAEGFLTQQNVGQPGCVAPASATSKGNINPSLNTCTAKGLLAYDWTNRAMYTEYTPCLPLLTPGNGSPETCSYTFLGGDIYYVYENQAIAAGPITGEPQCCVIDDFPMLSPSLPSYVMSYNQNCNTGPPTPIQSHAQTVQLMATPGNPAGFYGYFCDGCENAAGGATCYQSANGPAGVDGHVMPYGFGGMTPNDYSQMAFTVIEAKVRTIARPSVCGENPPPCMLNCVAKEGVSKCGSQTLSEFLGCLSQPQTGGCALCHTTESAQPYPETYPTCPNQPQDACPLIHPAGESP